MTRRQPLQVGAENVRDLVRLETPAKRMGNGKALQKPLRQTRERLEQVFDPNAILIAQYGPSSKFRQAGPTQDGVRNLMWEYGSRTPQERLELLAAIQMSPQEMGGVFDTENDIPELPESDPVLINCGRSGENAEKRMRRSRIIALDHIVTRDQILWTRAVTCFTNKGLSTLGDLSDADPDELAEVENYGIKQRILAGEILQTYRLLTPAWAEHLKKIRGD